MKLSIVIPVYCVEHTLDKCLKSVLCQQVASMEVILVDDGSPDNSPKKCEEWSLIDSRIKVVHQENKGLSAARNTGIELAQGDYITFVDSDDYLDKDTLNYLMTFCDSYPDCDIVEYPAMLYEGSDHQQLLSFTDKVYLSAKDYWDNTQAYYHTYACNKVFKRSVFRNIRFPIGKVFEDAYTLPLLLEKTNMVATCSTGLYHYCYNSQSITTTAGPEEWRMLLDAHLLIANNPLFHPLCEDYSSHLLNIQLYTSELTGDKPCIPVLNFKNVHTLKTILYQLLGINNLCTINRIFRKMVRRRS